MIFLCLHTVFDGIYNAFSYGCAANQAVRCLLNFIKVIRFPQLSQSIKTLPDQFIRWPRRETLNDVFEHQRLGSRALDFISGPDRFDRTKHAGSREPLT